MWARRFLAFGGHWGTEATLSDIGSRLWLTPETLTASTGAQRRSVHCYTIYTLLDGDQGTLMAYLSNVPSNDTRTPGVYMDRTSRANESITPVSTATPPVPENERVDYTLSYWQFIPVDDELYPDTYTYYIRSATDRYSNKRYLTYNADNDVNEFATANFETLDEAAMTNPNNMWRIISYEQVVELFSMTYADKVSPASASMFVLDPNIRRYHMYQDQWHWSGADEAFTRGIGTASNSGATEAERRLLSQYGSYYVVQFSGPGTYSQQLKLPMAGWYSLSCQGYGEGGSLFATVNLGDGTVAEEPSIYASSTPFIAAETPDEPMYRAGLKFARQHLYPNQIVFYVSPNDIAPRGYLRDGQEVPVALVDIGIRVDESVTADTPVRAKRFRLDYIGDAGSKQFLLDECLTEYPRDQHTRGQAWTMLLHRTLPVGKWSPLILPVNLTPAQFQTAFGIGARLAVFDSDHPVIGDNLNFKTVHYVELGKDVQSIQHNQFYLVMPTKEAYTDMGVVLDVDMEDAQTVPTPFYVVGGITLQQLSFPSPIEFSHRLGLFADPSAIPTLLTAVGKFYAIDGPVDDDVATTPFLDDYNRQGYYVFDDGVLVYHPLAEATAYMHSGTFPAYSYYIAGPEEVTGYTVDGAPTTQTGVEQIAATTHAAPNAWYDLYGRRLQSAPTAPGIYIHQGRKTVVR